MVVVAVIVAVAVVYLKVAFMRGLSITQCWKLPYERVGGGAI